ncbi:MAG TPA: RHS repeat-associated core domain-containing protein, partial [Patescibacteria group bacterium]|nr:RHS repeat-associated core domain-containing protein [Patescibacteria group bacterium]
MRSGAVRVNWWTRRITGTRTLYEPYGAPLPTPHDGSPSYTGHQYDTGTGLIYAQQRYYDPQLGIFYSPDPMAVDTTSAFNFNRYAYANNSPYKFTDPDGRAAIPAAGVGCAVTGPGCPVGATVGFIVGKIATAFAVVAVLDWA